MEKGDQLWTGTVMNENSLERWIPVQYCRVKVNDFLEERSVSNSAIMLEAQEKHYFVVSLLLPLAVSLRQSAEALSLMMRLCPDKPILSYGGLNKNVLIR